MNKPLGRYTQDELRRELARREEIDATPPPVLPNPDFSSLTALVVSIVKDAVEQEGMDEDAPHLVYGAAVEAIYGKEYWKWRNRQGW